MSQAATLFIAGGANAASVTGPHWSTARLPVMAGYAGCAGEIASRLSGAQSQNHAPSEGVGYFRPEY